MPLLSDSKTCYVGTQPITKIMAGAVEVWSKVFSFAGAKTTLGPASGPTQRRYYTSEFVANPASSKTNQEVYDLIEIESATEGLNDWAAVPFSDISFERWSNNVKMSWRSGVRDTGSNPNIDYYSAFRFRNIGETDWFSVPGKS